MDRPPALLALAAAFGLSPFERDLLLMCAGLELDADFRARSSAGPAHGAAPPAPDVRHGPRAAAGRALERARALGAAAPLATDRAAPPAARSPRRPCAQPSGCVHFLAGVQTLDAEIEGVVTVLDGPITARAAVELAASHAELADRAVRAFTSAAPLGTMPLVQLVGRATAPATIAAAVAARLGFGLAVLHADDIPSGAREREQLARLWEREAVLSSLLLLVDGDALGDEPHAATPASSGSSTCWPARRWSWPGAR